MPIRQVLLDPQAITSPIGLNFDHVNEALTRGLVFFMVIDQIGAQTLFRGYGYANLFLPQTKLNLVRDDLEDLTFLRVLYVQEADVAVVFAAHEAEHWEVEEYGTRL